MASLSEIVFACNVECALISRSLRFLFDSQPCRYSHTAFEGHTSSDVDHSHNYQRDNCICLQRSRDKQGGSHEKSHQECYIRGEKINATESVKPDSHLQNNRRSLIMQIAITLTTSSKTDVQLSSKRQKMLTFCETASNYEH